MPRWLKVIAGVVAVAALMIAIFIGTLWVMFAPESWPKRKARFERATQNGTALIEAIERYESTNGTLPPSLDALVPSFLKTIPGTGLSDYPAFEYEVFAESKSSLAWYDLGSRNGQPIDGLWVHVEGDPEHAILALTLNQQDRVVEARVDRMPKHYTRIGFDIEKWRRNEARIQMVRALPAYVPMKDRLFAEIQEMLGEPSGVSVLRNSPWELRIDCPNGGMNWDVFFYWPTHAYPQNIYGGSTERIGEWVYVHE